MGAIAGPSKCINVYENKLLVLQRRAIRGKILAEANKLVICMRSAETMADQWGCSWIAILLQVVVELWQSLQLEWSAQLWSA
jgi:hypothetical protein